jgi:hypothetical protein
MYVVGLWTSYTFCTKIRSRVNIKNMQLTNSPVLYGRSDEVGSVVAEDTEQKQWTVAFSHEVWLLALLNCSYISTAASTVLLLIPSAYIATFRKQIVVKKLPKIQANP